jgi:hypothetical protein
LLTLASCFLEVVSVQPLVTYLPVRKKQGLPILCAGTYRLQYYYFVVIFGGEKTVQSVLKQVKQQSNPLMQIYVNLLRPLSIFKKNLQDFFCLMENSQFFSFVSSARLNMAIGF